jgi:hypothetical protein
MGVNSDTCFLGLVEHLGRGYRLVPSLKSTQNLGIWFLLAL